MITNLSFSLNRLDIIVFGAGDVDGDWNDATVDGIAAENFAIKLIIIIAIISIKSNVGSKLNPTIQSKKKIAKNLRILKMALRLSSSSL